MKKIYLTQDEAEKLHRPISGEGGWQNLNHDLLAILKELDEPFFFEMMISDKLIERLNRYTNEYGEGGWQGRFSGVLNALRRREIE